MNELDRIFRFRGYIHISPLLKLTRAWCHSGQTATIVRICICLVICENVVSPVLTPLVVFNSATTKSGAESDIDALLAILDELASDHCWVFPGILVAAQQLLVDDGVGGWWRGQKENSSKCDILIAWRLTLDSIR